MSQKQINEIKPFVSLLLIISTLFLIVFMKMEVRRMGYHMLRQVKIYKSLRDDQRLAKIDYAQITSPIHLKEVARARFTLSEAKWGQIIQLSGESIALKQ